MIASSSSHNPPALVGRDRERKLLRELLDAAAVGHGSVVLVSGEAGIGKTTLIEDVAAEAAGQDMLVLSGGCYDLSTTPPYGPWIDILRAYPASRDLPPVPAELRERNELEKLHSQEHLFGIVANFLTDVTAANPLLLMLEDLHWSDRASIELLRYLARELAGKRLVILASYRDEDLDRSHSLFAAIPLMVREARAVRLELRRFEGDALRALVDGQYVLAAPDARRLTTYLYEHTEGNPLFATELLRSLEKEGILVESEGGWHVGELKEIVPPLVGQMIERRLGELESSARNALEIASVLGQEIELELWRELARLDEETLAGIIEQALIAGIIEPQGHSGLRFRHALIREVVYQGMLFPKRRLLHRQTAEALVQSGASDPESIAFHFQQAGDERAFEWLIRSGDFASRAWASFAAIERYQAALRLIEGDEERLRERGWLMLAIGQTGRDILAHRAYAYTEEAQRIGKQIGDEALMAWALFTRGDNRIFRGQNGLPEMEQGLALIRTLPSTSLPELPSRFRRRQRYAVETNVMDADIIVMQALFGRYREVLANTESYLATDSLENDFHLTLRGHAEVARAVALSVFGDPEGAAIAYRNAHELYRRGGGTWHRALIATAELESVTLAYRTDQLAERRRHAAQVEALWTQVDGITTTDLPPRFGLLPLLVVEGKWTEACELASPFADRGVAFYYFALHALGMIARFRGEPDIAWDRVHAALPDGFRTEPGSVWMPSSMELQRLAAELALDAENLELAQRWIEAHDRWLEWSERVWGRAEAQILWARYYHIAGDLEAAYQHARLALEFASDPRQPLALIAAYRSLGEIDTARGDYADAGQHLGRALDWAEACAASYEQALTLLALANLGAATGDPDAAWQQIDQVRAICAPLGASPALQRAATIAARLSVRRERHVHPAGLTPREAEILQLVAQGMTNREIADRLFISPRTINTHLTSIYNKLGVNSRGEAAHVAFQLGLLSRSPDESV